MKANLYLYLMVFLPLTGFGQIYNMTNGSTTTCSGTFRDNGGLNNYSDNQTLTYTFCPSTPGTKIQLNFTTFELENSYDFLEIYDGPNTSAPSLGAYTGILGPGLVQATSSNTSGCLTFVFTSDLSVTKIGWQASIACIQHCQTINAVLNSTSPAADPSDDIIRLCQGQSVSFTGSGTFSGSSTGATYTWSMGNGVTLNGTNINYTYPSEGSYLVNLSIQDPNGCINNNVFNQVVQVATTPTLATAASPNVLCQNTNSSLTGTATPTTFNSNCTPPVSGTTFLPDGSGVSYTTAIPVNCFATGQTVTSPNDIQDICINMEHSYLGDLEIKIICPNGQSAILKSYADGGSNTYLGAPIDDLTSGPGTGSTYCFTPTATTLLVNGATANAGSPSSPAIVPGNYMPTDSFTNLVGCPANGNWTIEVTDNLAQDDGYIFNWDINLTGVLTSAGSFTPTIISESWDTDPSLTDLGNGNANITPSTLGNNCYYYEAIDNFNCVHRDTICINVTPVSTAPTVAPVGSICPNTTVTLTAGGGQASPGSNLQWYSGPNGTGTWLGTGGSISVTPSATTDYYVRREGGCNTTSDDVVNVQLKDFIYGLNGASSNTYCTDNNGWHHFYNGSEILLSVQGDLSGAPTGFPMITINDNGSYYQMTQNGTSPTLCAGGTSPGEERFEMARNWDVDFGGGTLNPPYNVRFYYRPAERVAIETAAANWLATYTACGYAYLYPNPLGFYWFKNTGANYTAPDYDGLHLAGSPGMTANSINYTELTGINSFSGGSGGIRLVPNILLPVTWLYFTGENKNKENKVNHLSWGTKEELNALSFRVQRSKDGSNFTTIGEVAAVGQSSTTQHYQFADENPYEGVNYYRLEQLDDNGDVSYSSTIQLIVQGDDKAYLFYPNPTKDYLYYEYETEQVELIQVEVLNTFGQRLQQRDLNTQVGINTLPIDLSDYPAGTYWVRITHANSSDVHTTKVLKSSFDR